MTDFRFFWRSENEWPFDTRITNAINNLCTDATLPRINWEEQELAPRFTCMRECCVCAQAMLSKEIDITDPIVTTHTYDPHLRNMCTILHS